MKVKELIEKLSTLDQEADIVGKTWSQGEDEVATIVDISNYQDTEYSVYYPVYVGHIETRSIRKELPLRGYIIEFLIEGGRYHDDLKGNLTFEKAN